MNQLKGNSVYLRALEPDDALLLYNWENDTSTWHLSNTQAPYSLHMLKQFAQADNDIYTNKQLRLIICLHDHSPIGAIDLFDFSPHHQRAGVGILIARQELRGKGYGSEALDLLIDYSFNTLELQQIYCNVLSENEHSLQLFQKKKFTICGTKKNWIKDGNQWKDEQMLQLLREHV